MLAKSKVGKYPVLVKIWKNKTHTEMLEVQIGIRFLEGNSAL
jgi:hypothetical protein